MSKRVKATKNIEGIIWEGSFRSGPDDRAVRVRKGAIGTLYEDDDPNCPEDERYSVSFDGYNDIITVSLDEIEVVGAVENKPQAVCQEDDIIPF